MRGNLILAKLAFRGAIKLNPNGVDILALKVLFLACDYDRNKVVGSHSAMAGNSRRQSSPRSWIDMNCIIPM